jgi:hypothetical protein
VFLADDPTTVIGVVTSSFESHTQLEEVVEEERCGDKTRVRVEKVITCGVAANIFGAVDTIEDILGRRSPQPEPERTRNPPWSS